MPFLRQILNGSARWWHLCLIIMAFWATISAHAKGTALAGLERLEHLPPANPLTGQWIRVVYQDRLGFLWLGTINGVHRFDGFEAKSFRHDPDDPMSLPNNFINAIFEDHQGVLWIATMDGLARLEDQSPEAGGPGQFVTTSSAGLFTTFRHDPENPTSLSHDRITGIAEDKNGRLWLSTYEGVNRFDRDQQSFTRFAIDPTDLSGTRTLTVLQSQTGDIWFGGNGLLRFDPQSETLEHHPIPGTDRGLRGIWRIAEDDDGFLWSGTETGALYRFDPRTNEAQGFDLGEESRGYVTALLPQPDGQLWIGTDKQGLLILDTEMGTHRAYQPAADQPGSLSGVQVSAIFRDHSGVVWLGTSSGLDKYVPSKERFALHRRRVDDSMSLGSDNISAVLGDSDGRLWLGTQNGLELLDSDGRVGRRYRHNPNDPHSLLSDSVSALFKDKGGSLWVGTDQGLDLFDAERETFTHLRPDDTDPHGLIETIYCLAEIEPGIMWIAGHGGINRLDTSTRQMKRYREPRAVIAMTADVEAGLWLATYRQGLMHFDPEEEVFSTYRHDQDDPRSLRSDFLVALHRDRSGLLWIGTLGGGLNRFDPEREEFTSYRERDGLANDNVTGILEDATGQLWLSTHRGLSRFDPLTETWTNYTVEDGLQGSVFNYGAMWHSPTGEMFFGGTAGLTSFVPEQITGDPRPPQVAITDFLLLNRSTPFAVRRIGDAAKAVPHLSLGHRDDIFAFKFAALHLAKPGKNRYAYMLEGFNQDWIETDSDNRLAQYTNLDAGDYVFRVKAANPDGVWNEQGTEVHITVRPPPWQTWWAYSLYTLALTAVILGYVRSHRHELQRQREVAEHQRHAAQRERAVSRRLRDVDKLKDEFLANTSHELRTPLYGITGLAESLIDGAAGELPAAARANLAMIVASGQRLGHLVGDILDFSKLRHKSLELNRGPIDLKPLVDVVLTLSRPLVGAKDLELINAVPADLPAADADENRLQQILYNLIGNAIKFTEAGSVEVSASAGDSSLQVQIADTGIGIPEADQERIFGAFEQADGSTEREFGGTGLGLAVTRQLVEVHGGTMHLESAADMGSTFSFSLPIASESNRAASLVAGDSRTTVPAMIAAEQPHAEGHKPIATDPATLAKTSAVSPYILVVDDEPINRQVLVNQLVAEGYDIVQAASGPEALKKIEQRLPDLVLLDVMMPRMSGYEVCRTLRSRFTLDELPVLFLTAKSQSSDLVVGLAAGANDYLPKPISKSELLARVTTHLGLRTVNRQLSQLVAQRTAEVEERGRLLRERQRLIDELETRNDELARFNYTISHDLKNPVTTIRNFLGLARRDAAQGETDRLEHDLDRLQTAADKLNRLLEELFEFSRVGVQTNPPTEVAFSELVSTAKLALTATIAERKATVDIASDLPSVHGDRKRLEEMLRHLIHNALRYTDERTVPRIEIGSRRQDDDPTDRAPTFYIRDNGVGIDARYHEKIFDLFERLDSQGSTSTGIGLALAKRIIEVHGGKIWVESDGVGQGSTFYFTLPQALEPADNT